MMVDSRDNSHNPSVAEKIREKLVVMKDKLIPGHQSDSTTASPGAAPTQSQKQSLVGKIKDKVMPGRQGPPSGTEGLGGTTSGVGYETMHGEEDVKAAEAGHHHRVGEKIAHMMPGPPYIQRHEKKSGSAED